MPAEVPACGMISTPGMNGDGLEKCTPRKRSGLVTGSDSSAMEIVEVLEPMMASGRAAALMRARVWCLMAMTSGTASSMKSASATASSMSLAAQRFCFRISVEPAGKRPSATNWSDSARSLS